MALKNCVTCGVEFNALRKALTCGEECRTRHRAATKARWHKEHPKPRKTHVRGEAA